jgi:hypothetical protein
MEIRASQTIPNKKKEIRKTQNPNQEKRKKN